MSKKNDAAFDDFLADILATVPADKRAHVEDAFKDDAAKTKLREGVLARKDYSRQSDELADARKSLEKAQAEASELIKRNTDWYASANQEFNTIKAKHDQYVETYGDLESGDGKKGAKRFISDEDFVAKLDEALRPRDAAAIDVADCLTDLKIEHRTEFGEKLDTKALIKLATEKHLPLDVAYSQFVIDKRDVKRKSEFDEALKKAREEGAKEFAATHRLPVIAGSPEQYSYSAPADVPRTAHDRVSAAAADFAAAISTKS